MPQVNYKEKTETVLNIEARDSMGRTQEQIDAMDANAQRPPKIGKKHREYAAAVARDNATYPKAFYRLSLATDCLTGTKTLAAQQPTPCPSIQRRISV